MDGLVFTAFEMTVGMVVLRDYSAISGATFFNIWGLDRQSRSEDTIFAQRSEQ